MINTITDAIKSIFSIKEAIDEKSVVCSIDEEPVNCKDLETEYGWLDKEAYSIHPELMYTGVPAPAYLKDDEWFGSAVISDENKDYMEREYEAFKEEAHKFYGTKESENIHQEIYEIATASQNTTVHLDPVIPVGGSENFQEGPGGWTSGNGMNQFRHD